MATIDRAFHVSVTPEIRMPVIIPAADLPDVELHPDGSYGPLPYKVTSPERARRVALEWLAAERALRHRADIQAEIERAEAAIRAEKVRKQREAADKARTEAARKLAAREAAVIAEAQELRKAFYSPVDVGPWHLSGTDTKERWLKVARESLTRLGKLDPDE
jgi:hypothetical protein